MRNRRKPAFATLMTTVNASVAAPQPPGCNREIVQRSINDLEIHFQILRMNFVKVLIPVAGLENSFIDNPGSLPLKPFKRPLLNKLDVNTDAKLGGQPFTDGIDEGSLFFHLVKKY